MKKVGILTINDDGNFGNRLQNYAVQETLKKKKIDVETINNQKGVIGFNIIKKKIKCFIKLFIPKQTTKRYVNFIQFNKNIKYSKTYIDMNNISNNLNNQYDCFFTGSDQVWNPTFNRMSDIDFLTFADKNKRNSFSASFGIEKVPQDMEEYYRKRLNNLNNISVREDAGKKIIEDLTGRTDVEVLIDPTMLLTSKEWDKVSKKPKQMKILNGKKYILNYFLGELSAERKKEINRIARENDCEIINILDKKDPFYVSGPSEFLYLEKHAFLICTDSFHSSVFAILYNKPFIIFDREDKEENMNSRIETLINKFELKDRKYNGKKITKENINHDYTKAYEILIKEREKSNKFLEKSLSI